MYLKFTYPHSLLSCKAIIVGQYQYPTSSPRHRPTLPPLALWSLLPGSGPTALCHEHIGSDGFFWRPSSRQSQCLECDYIIWSCQLRTCFHTKLMIQKNPKPLIDAASCQWICPDPSFPERLQTSPNKPNKDHWDASSDFWGVIPFDFQVHQSSTQCLQKTTSGPDFGQLEPDVDVARQSILPDI